MHWRFIDSGPGTACWNMAVDEALLVLAAGPGARPVLRFFSWDVPSLSIGSFQKAEELDLAAVAARSIPIVRRPTGGRAVLHDAELTYSVAAAIPSPSFPSDLMGSYKTIGQCFLRGLMKLGVEAALVPVDRNPERRKYGHNPLCFSSPSWYEVLLGGKKLIGSAQRRLTKSFLQQGSLLIDLDVEGLPALMDMDEVERLKAADALKGKMTALSEHHPGIAIEDLKRAIVAGFSEELNAEFVPDTLTEEEIGLAERLLAEKYSRGEWNLERNGSVYNRLL